MNDELGTSIILTMAPIFVLMIGLVIYGVMKNRSKDKGHSKRETDAIIEAQAMLAKYQKEQAEKKPEDKKSEEKPEEKTEEKSEPKEDSKKSEEKPKKPSVEAPISDTTELEPDIDKTTNE